jgi:hypothetical protein
MGNEKGEMRGQVSKNSLCPLRSSGLSFPTMLDKRKGPLFRTVATFCIIGA